MVNDLTKTLFGKKLHSTMTLADALTFLQEQRLIQVGELAERAISKKAGVALCPKNTEGIDTVTGKQIKHAQTQLDKVEKKAWVSKKNTTAPILAVVTEQLTGKQYFFHFPYAAYCWMSANAFSIPFYNDGTPFRKNSWWQYEVSSFKELCELAK